MTGPATTEDPRHPDAVERSSATADAHRLDPGRVAASPGVDSNGRPAAGERPRRPGTASR
ncbi:hypothetical protein ACFY30_28570 [Streptomyces sp. NPDC000345]|uniref:hypothetical protein n=1 Tax=Streptomyces sp. NPDC000345 TaxID=3364537 RepID=UPI0036C60E70